MRMTKTSILILALTIAMSTALALAQKGKGQRQYNPATETTVTGTVEEVKKIPGPSGGPGGTHLMIKTAQGSLEVHLGPTSYLEGQQFAFAKGDQIEVIGSRVKIESADVVIAREVKKGGKSLTLRDAQGVPAWSKGKGGPK
jgi:hypothetical protein